MAEVAVFDNNGEGVKLSETMTWEVTVGDVKGGFDVFTKFTGPFKPEENVKLAEMRAKNTGGIQGKLWIDFSKVDSAGNVVTQICKEYITGIPAGDCFYLDNADGTCNILYNSACDTIGELWHTLPSTGGTYYYACKVWGEDESEPSFALAMQKLSESKKWGVEVTGEEGEEGDNTKYYVLGALAVATAAIGAVAMRR